MPDTDLVLRIEARRQNEADHREQQALAHAYITRRAGREGWPPEELELVLASLDLDGAEPLPGDLCRMCGLPLPTDGRKLCKRARCQRERARLDAERGASHGA